MTAVVEEAIAELPETARIAIQTVAQDLAAAYDISKADAVQALHRALQSHVPAYPLEAVFIPCSPEMVDYLREGDWKPVSGLKLARTPGGGWELICRASEVPARPGPSFRLWRFPEAALEVE